jgi:polysaccharide biosynthesis transport protein
MYGPIDAEAEGRQALDETPSIFCRLPPAIQSLGRSAGLTLSMTLACAITIPFAATQLVGTNFRAETQIAVTTQGPDAIHSAIRDVGSKPALDNVVRALNLASGEESRPTIIRVVSEILSGEVTTVSQTEEAARQKLRDAMSVNYDPAAGSISLAAQAGDPQIAAAIANQLAGELRRALASSTGDAPNPQVDAMRKAAGRAESALAGFVGKLDEETRGKLQSLHDERNSLDADIAGTEQRLTELNDKQQMASSMKLADVLARPLPDSLEFTGLEYERQRYVQAELSVQQLAVNLGPRHPRLIAAQGALDGARRDLGSALRQLTASLNDDLASTKKTLAELKDRRTALEADKPLNETMAQLSSLQAAAEEARHNLEKIETTPSSSRRVAASVPPVLRVASPAAAERLGPDVIRLSGLGALVGLLAGLALTALRYKRQSRLADEFEDMPVHLDLPEQDRLVEPAAPELVAEDAWHDRQAEIEPYLDHEPEEERFAANDTAFGDRMRALLIENRLSTKQASLPPHVAALVDESVSRRGEESWQRWDDAPDYDHEELLRLQRELAELRELVAEHAARQLKATG